MLNEAFRIYVDQLREGQVEEISETLNPDFLDIHEKELSFSEPIVIDGEAYLTDDSLVMRLNASTSAKMPCSICNEQVEVGIKLKDFYHSEPLSEIKTGVYNFSEMLREAILLEVPPFAECFEGKCPTRAEVHKYMKLPSEQVEEEDEGYQPFANLDIEIEKSKNKKKKVD